jgi:guanylate kinase
VTARRGLLIVISGPSGVGKDTLIRKLLDLDPNLRYSVSYTTRRPREGEVEGVNYHFVDRARFEGLINEGALLEHATYDGNLYGTPLAPLETMRAAGHDELLKIDVQGAEQVRRRAPDALLIFLAPPSMDELNRRRAERHSESLEDSHSRQAIAEHEMKLTRDFHQVVVNDDLDRAAREVAQIIGKARAAHT